MSEIGVRGDSIPDMLKKGRYCLWKYQDRGDGSKPAKVPYNPKTGIPLDVTKPAEFGTYNEAFAGYQAGGYDGIGIRVDRGLVGIDIDHCIGDNGSLSPLAQSVINAMNNSYVEVSPSGRGIRIFCLCSEQFAYDKDKYLMKNGKRGLEIYIGGQTARYVTVTGHAVLDGAEVGVRDSELQQVLDTYMLRQTAPAGNSQPEPYSQSGQTPKGLTQADEELIERIYHSDSGAQFSALMDGDMSSCNGDHSSADLALANILAARTGDGEQIDRIFRTSKLMRPKWDEKHGSMTYGEMTVNRALEGTAQYRSIQLPVNITPAQLAVLRQMPSAIGAGTTYITNPLLRKPKPLVAVLATEEATEKQGVEPEEPTPPVPSNPLLRPKTQSGAVSTTSNSAGLATIMDLQDLMNIPIKPPEFIVSEILPVGLTILAAQPKVGKSWMALYLAICLTLGEPFLGYSVQRCGVLYLALEDSHARLKYRSQKLLGNQQIPRGLDVMISAPSLQDEPGLIETLEQHLSNKPDTRLVIIDTLQKVRGVGGSKETLYGYDYRELGKLKTLIADKYNICLMVIHHTRKMKDDNPYNMISGSNGIMGAADTAWLIERGEKKDGKTAARLHITGRDVNVNDLKLEFNAQTCIWENLGSAEDCEAEERAEAYENDELVRTLRDLLDNSPNGMWEGLATDIVLAGHAKGWLVGSSAQKVAMRLTELEPLLLQNDGIQHKTAKVNGNGGKKHYFSIIKQDDNGTQNAQASPSITPEQLDAVQRVASAAGAVSVTNNPLLRKPKPPAAVPAVKEQQESELEKLAPPVITNPLLRNRTPPGEAAS